MPRVTLPDMHRPSQHIGKHPAHIGTYALPALSRPTAHIAGCAPVLICSMGVLAKACLVSLWNDSVFGCFHWVEDRQESGAS